jgi:hypothetical protein
VSVNNPDFRATVLAQYDSFAVLARSAAAGESLENVRQKHLTSAVTWEQLAANGRKMEADRTSRTQDQLLATASARIPPETPLALARLDNWQEGSPPRFARRSRIPNG